MIIKILGAGCRNCDKLEKNIEKFLKESDMRASIEKVQDLGEIARYGIMRTPALVVDNKVVSTGKVLSVKEIGRILEKYL